MYDDLEPGGSLFASDDYVPGDAGPIRFRRNRDVGEVINVTIRFLRENLREFGRVLLVVFGPVLLVTALGNYLFQRSMYATMEQAQRGGYVEDPFAFVESLFSPAYAVTVLLMMLAPILLAALTYGYINLYRSGEYDTIGPRDVWDEAQRLILPYIGYALVYAAVLMLSAVVVIVPCLGILAWGFLWVYSIPVVSLLYVARATDTNSLGEAFGRARHLVKGRWWFCFGVLFVALLILMVAAIALSIPLYALGFGTMFNSLAAETPPVMSRGFIALSALLGTLNYVLYVVPTVALAFLYGSLTEQEEGTTLYAQVDAMAAASPPAAVEPSSFRDAPASGFGFERPDAPPSDPPASRPPDGFRGGGFDDDPDRA